MSAMYDVNMNTRIIPCTDLVLHLSCEIKVAYGSGSLPISDRVIDHHL